MKTKLKRAGDRRYEVQDDAGQTLGYVAKLGTLASCTRWVPYDADGDKLTHSQRTRAQAVSVVTSAAAEKCEHGNHPGWCGECRPDVPEWTI